LVLNVLQWILLLQVGPRLPKDRERFPPNNMLLVLTGAGLLWLGWSGFNGGATFSANLISGLAVLNTHVCAAASLLTWTTLDVIVFGKPSVIGAVQGMMTGLVVITPAAGKPQCVHHSSHIALTFIKFFSTTALAHCRLDYSYH
jgi:ammonia channel protein AmtB